jgi:Coenzyme PQQ synthesis protein D (PqqD)
MSVDDPLAETPKREVTMHLERANSDAFVVNQLPDGSRIIVDPMNEKVFALNATAGAAWDACSNPTTLASVTEKMQRSFDHRINEELAEEAILQLQDHKLVKTSESSVRSSRRKFLATLGAVAVPLVVSLTIADQRAHAVAATSKPTTSPCASVNPKCKS